MTASEGMEWLVDNDICTQEEYNLVSDINGHSMETVNAILYARTGYRSIEQMTDEDDEEEMDVYPDAKFYVHTTESRVYGAPEHQSVVLVSGNWEKPEAMLIIMPMDPVEEGDRDYMEKDGLVWIKPLLDKYDLNRCIHHKDWDKRLQQGIKTEQDVKDDETIKKVAEFFNINLD